ncbi:hypothetical protein M5E88_18200 [Akkermansia muciniphila]|nr:hypothetical protein M5E88_18200 [Akkermansia muciniphila]
MHPAPGTEVRHPRAGEAAIPAPILTEGVDIQLTASRQGGNKQVYELLIGDLPPRLITDPSPPEQPLQGDAFGLQMEGHVSLTISKLALSSITLSAKSVAKNGNAETDLVLTKEEDAIPGSVSGYDSKTGTLTLSTDKDYPGIPRDFSIPAKYLDTVFLRNGTGKTTPAPSPPQPPDEGRFPPARRYSEHGFPEYHPAASAARTDFPSAEKHHPRGIPESRPAIPFHSLIDPAMKQAMTLFLCACALPTALLLPHARSEGVITLKSGEKLPGSMDTMNRPYLKVRSSILSKPVDVHMGELDELASSRPLEIPEQFSIIRLANGDEVYGTLKALDAENLQLQTAWGGLLQVDRKYVRHIGFDSQKPTCATLRNPCRAGSLQPKARCPNAATDTGSCAAPIIRNCKLPSPCHPASMCSSPFTIPIRSGLILPSGRIPNPETASTWISPWKKRNFPRTVPASTERLAG